MSAKLDQLLTRQQRADADAADAAQRKALQQRAASHYGDQAKIIALEADIAGLKRELDTLAGRNATPQNDCFHVACFLGDADVLVEFEYEPASGDGWNQPREEESVTLLCALVNGVWVDAHQFAESVQEAWQQRAIDWQTEQAKRAADDAAEARSEARFA